MRKTRWLLILFLIAATALIILGRGKLSRLQQENRDLREVMAQLQQAKDPRPASTEKDSGELAQLRAEHSELLRLRGEISRLRQAPKLQISTSPSEDEQKPSAVTPPVETFSSSVEADVAPGGTLVTGGWDTASNKKTFLFVEPQMIDEAGNPLTAGQAKQKAGAAQINFQARFAEVSQESLQALGLENLLPGSDASGHFVMDEIQSRLLFKNMAEAAGVEILSAPRVTTLNGRQAQVRVVNEKVIDNQRYHLGPTVDLTPQISADGRFIRVMVRSSLTRENPLTGSNQP